MAWVTMAPSEDIRVASHGGTRPPCRGRSALPVRLAMRTRTSLNRYDFISFGLGASRFRRCHGSEGDRISGLLDRGNTVLPDFTRGPGHHVERARLGLQCEPLPTSLCGPAKPEFARGTERQAEHLAEM